MKPSRSSTSRRGTAWGDDLNPDDLLDAARSLASGSPGPTQAGLRRAQSTVYYALFHVLAGTCADLLVPGGGPAWHHAYRALDHGQARAACRDPGVRVAVPVAVWDFAEAFVDLQEKRHQADYDPLPGFGREEVKQDIEAAASILARFRAVPPDELRAFVAFVVLRRRR